MKQVKLYSILPIYPMFIAMLIPPYSGILLGWNFLILSVILVIVSKLCFKKVSGKFYCDTIFSAWLLGFAAIAICSFVGLAEFFLDYYIDYDVSEKLGCAVSFFVAVVMIFLFTMMITLNPKRHKDFKMTMVQRILTSLAIAISTAPYSFFLPEKYAVFLSDIWDNVFFKNIHLIFDLIVKVYGIN